jgi:hypothetical protein
VVIPGGALLDWVLCASGVVGDVLDDRRHQRLGFGVLPAPSGDGEPAGRGVVAEELLGLVDVSAVGGEVAGRCRVGLVVVALVADEAPFDVGPVA